MLDGATYVSPTKGLALRTNTESSALLLPRVLAVNAFRSILERRIQVERFLEKKLEAVGDHCYSRSES